MKRHGERILAQGFLSHGVGVYHPPTRQCLHDPEALQTSHFGGFNGGFITQAWLIIKSISSPFPLSGLEGMTFPSI